MRREIFSAVAVVDRVHGKIVGNVSATDARSVVTDQERIALLSTPLLDFSDLRVEPMDMEAITCLPNELLADVIAKLARTKVSSSC